MFYAVIIEKYGMGVANGKVNIEFQLSELFANPNLEV